MALNYAEQWSPELLEILIQGALTSPFITSNVRWLDAKTFHFTQMSTSGYKNHNRKGGWNAGTYDQKDLPYTLTHDRDVEFLVDKADVDETNATASIQNISRVFEQTWVVPETDALFFSILVHWNKSPRDTEKAATALFQRLRTARDEKVNNEKMKFFQPLYDIQDVGTDEAGVYEMVIEGVVIFEKEGKTV